MLYFICQIRQPHLDITPGFVMLSPEPRAVISPDHSQLLLLLPAYLLCWEYPPLPAIFVGDELIDRLTGGGEVDQASLTPRPLGHLLPEGLREQDKQGLFALFPAQRCHYSSGHLIFP